MLEYFMQMLSKRREVTWKLLGGSCIFCIFYLNTVLVYWLVYILYISSPHQSTTSHPPSFKSSSALPSWGEISTNVLSSEKFEALELLVEGWTPIPNIHFRSIFVDICPPNHMRTNRLRAIPPPTLSLSPKRPLTPLLVKITNIAKPQTWTVWPAMSIWVGSRSKVTEFSWMVLGHHTLEKSLDKGMPVTTFD